MKKFLLFIWNKSNGGKTVFFNTLAAYLQYMVAEEVFHETKFLTFTIKTLLFLGMLSLGHKGIKHKNKIKQKNQAK